MATFAREGTASWGLVNGWAVPAGVLVGAAAVALALRGPGGSFRQIVALETAGGSVTLMLAPVVVAAVARWKAFARGLLLVFGFALGVLAYRADGVFRDLLVESAGAVALLLVFEVMVRRWVERVRHACEGRAPQSRG